MESKSPSNLYAEDRLTRVMMKKMKSRSLDLDLARHLEIVSVCAICTPQGEAELAVRLALQIQGVSVILGNNLIGAQVWADVPPPVVVAPVPLVLKQLRVQHNRSSAYHAQSQGALERFHQTLKSLLRAYCTELDKDWEEGLPWLMLAAREGCAVYLDDVVIYSNTWETHLGRIRELFTWLAEARLMVNLEKCEFARATMTDLGRVVGQGEVRPIDAKVQAVEQYPVPTTATKTPPHWLRCSLSFLTWRCSAEHHFAFSQTTHFHIPSSCLLCFQ
ncbi:hypothetical protein L3Q82_000937 [Scortum barcoo]|uniref:Uncharacterized protein n=1 Tax=Scortum barcoo TaxID=214431 RepID=A0ACB8WAS9_9TELE|nr:hypothetical protein L3Q82_000937 [Scortum barcoo]